MDPNKGRGENIRTNNCTERGVLGLTEPVVDALPRTGIPDLESVLSPRLMLRDFLVTPTLRRYELAPEVSGANVGDRGPSRHRDGGPRWRVPDPGSLLLSVSGREDGDRALAL